MGRSRINGTGVRDGHTKHEGTEAPHRAERIILCQLQLSLTDPPCGGGHTFPDTSGLSSNLCHTFYTVTASAQKEERDISYIDSLKAEANTARTLNGAKAYAGTSDACLDFFAVAGGMRYKRPAVQIALFDRAYIETPDLAMRLMFHLRDIRGGMGERKLFRTLLRHVSFEWPESAVKNVRYISEFGRWDDLICLLGTPAQDEAVRIIREQLSRDEAALRRREGGDDVAHISLLAKWLPSDNASSRRTRKNAQLLIKALGMDGKDYRSLITSLRARIGLTECQLTFKRPEKVNYEAVPAQAMLKYRGAFHRADDERFGEYLKKVKSGKKGIHAGTLFPYEILRPFFNRDGEARDCDVLERLWKNLPGSVANANAISVVDTSGSMYSSRGNIVPALISQAMGLYCAERCRGLFHDYLITFESTPHLIQIRGNTLRDRLNYISSFPWGGSTNLESVFDLILNAAVKAQAPQDEMPEVVYIFSDMEFNRAMRNADMTVYEAARAKFEKLGYKMPAVVFHNVNSWQLQTPVTAHTLGTALTSGSSVHAMESKFDGNVTPMDHMLRVLNGERYAMISA